MIADVKMVLCGEIPAYTAAAVAAVNGNAYDVMSLASVISSFIFAKVAINFITLQG
jgi:hypothetical protein